MHREPDATNSGRDSDMSHFFTRREFLTIGVSTSAAVALASCQPTPVAAPQATSGPGASTGPRRGGNLNVDTGADAIRLPGPQQLGSQTTKNLSYNYAETLAYRDSQMKLQPLLATAWRVADDGVTWTFDLRKGVKFHDGSPLNAAAVKANIDHWLDPKSQSVVRTTYTRLIDSARVVDDS